MGETAASIPLDAAHVTALRERLNSVRQRVDAAVKKSGQKPGSVVLIVVTKTASIEQIREMVNMGQVDFGENRVQQLSQRAATIGEWLSRRKEMDPQVTLPTVRWHMVGSLQRNKVKKCVEVSRLIHSIDSLRIAEEVQEASTRRPARTEVLLEVNVSGDSNKHGISPPAVKHMVDQLSTMPNLKPRGLMCMGPLEGGVAAARETFLRCRELFEEVRGSGAGGDRFDILSMGMSGDFEMAIECGSNMVRVGSAVIGEPQVSESGED
ncbi:MAG: YggS family pyridoxal phosphate-dependent enzyme [Planctomycetes bacterium]|nr:YggS family pyridoxal phosphate-dependent enzyme [Planctomycetota bacterium]